MECDRPVKGIDMEGQLKLWEEDEAYDEKVSKKGKPPGAELDDIAKLPVVHKKGTETSKKGDSDGLGGIYSF